VGYRSAGAFRAAGNTDDLFAVIAAARLSYTDQTSLCAVLKDCTLSEGLFGFDIEDWKWYDSYPEVQALEYLMGQFQNDEAKFDTAFVRIGEDNGDIEITYTGEDSYELVEFQRGYNATPFEGTNLLSSTIDETRSEDGNQELVT